jgi:hypothetical protein
MNEAEHVLLAAKRCRTDDTQRRIGATSVDVDGNIA